MSLHHTQGNGLRLSTMVSKGSDMTWKHYARDGTGRDCYIALNQGGLQSTLKVPESSAFNGTGYYFGNNQSGPRTDVYPSSPGKCINYPRNGTGRDSYISKSNGGFYPSLPVAEYQSTFKDQLRISHYNTREPTIDYLSRRNARMRNYSKGSRMTQMLKDSSNQTSSQRGRIIEDIARGSVGGDQLLPPTQGFITNSRFNTAQKQKGLFQTIHINCLAEPKRVTDKYEHDIELLSHQSPDNSFFTRNKKRNLFNSSITKEMLRSQGLSQSIKHSPNKAFHYSDDKRHEDEIVMETEKRLRETGRSQQFNTIKNGFKQNSHKKNLLLRNSVDIRGTFASAAKNKLNLNEEFETMNPLLDEEFADSYFAQDQQRKRSTQISAATNDVRSFMKSNNAADVNKGSKWA